MPKYSITNAQFSPFSFEEMVRPYQLATEKYEKQVDTFNKLAEDIDAVDYLAQSLPDESPYKKQFNAYLEQFNKAGDTLSQGWSPDTASNLMNLRRMYHNTLVPIQKADQIRTKTADTQNAIRAKDPTVRFEVDATDPNSLGYFLDNPGTPAIKSYSQNAILQSAASQIKNLKEQLYQNNSFEALGEEGKLLAQNTLSQEDVAKIMKNPELYPNISSIINTAIDSSGLSNWSDEGKEQESTNAWSTALSGMNIGLSVAENPNFIPASKQIEYGLKQRQLDIQALRAYKNSSRNRSSSTDSSKNSAIDFNNLKGNQTPITTDKERQLIAANGLRQIETSGIPRVVKPDGTVSQAKKESNLTNAYPISTEDVLNRIEQAPINTFYGYQLRAAIANETKGYLDRYDFYEKNTEDGKQILMIPKEKTSAVLGWLYNYENEGFPSDFKTPFNKKDDWDAAITKAKQELHIPIFDTKRTADYEIGNNGQISGVEVQKKKKSSSKKKQDRKTPQQAVDSTNVVKPKTERASDNQL